MRPDSSIFYVGKGSERRTRIKERKSNPHHCHIVSKYGKESIIVKSMLCRNEQHSLDLEVRMIAALRNGGVKLVNLTDGGEGVSGFVISKETRAKLSESAKKRPPMSEDARKKIGYFNKGKITPIETRLKMSASMKGLKRSAEARANISKAQKIRFSSRKTRSEDEFIIENKKLINDLEEFKKRFGFSW